MQQKYKQWIENKLLTGDDPHLHCLEWSEEMLAVFPELYLLRGHVLLNNGWFRPHWWLINPSNDIVDPTERQFSEGFYQGCHIIDWLPTDESEPPTGKCMNCGDYCFNNEFGCSDECIKELERYYNCPMTNNFAKIMLTQEEQEELKQIEEEYGSKRTREANVQH